MEGPQGKGQVAVEEKLGAGGTHFRGREVRAGFTEEQLLKLRPRGEKKPAKQHWVGMFRAHRGPAVRNGGPFEGPRSQVTNWTKQEENHSGRDWQSAEVGHMAPPGLQRVFAFHCSTVRSPG